MVRRLLPTSLLVVLGSSVAVAEAPQYGTHRDVVRVFEPEKATEHALVSPIIYLNRCVGGCTLTPGADDDAPNNRVHPQLLPGETTFTAFTHGDTVWNELVQCVKEIYSPFDVQVVTERPGAGTQYHMAIIAGTSQEAMRPGALGVAIVNAGSCTPRNNGVSLTFANSHSPGASLVHDLCWTVGQESAHSFGLDHSFKWLDGRSTCNDPLTYQSDCGGQRFFRNDTATCGEFQARSCSCGSTQNSHAKLLNTFGPNPNPSGIPAPTAMVTTPAANTALGAQVVAMAGSKRGVAKVELIINGFKWAEAKGANFGRNGQPNPSQYQLMVPANLPNSKVDVVVRAYDDLGAFSDSPVVASFKGDRNGCVDASGCLAGQKCEAGYCKWDPPAGEIGDECTYPQFCKSLNCQGAEGEMICTQNCVPGSEDACPDGLECIATSSAQGICYFKGDEGGCCSVSSDDDGRLFVHGGVALLLMGVLLRRRRK